jgi:[protein-PII] uridylyltransferase
MAMESSEMRDLFDARQFEAKLQTAPAPLPVFKEALAEGGEYLRQRFANGAPVAELVSAQSHLVDELVRRAWRLHDLGGKPYALVAVGGYGRGELHPGSDVDILILWDSAPNPDDNRRIETFLRLLWDIGLEIGQSVRTVSECRDDAAADITIVTNLMESRLLAGNQALFEDMLAATGPQSIWPAATFFEAKLVEQATRHRKYRGTGHNLEPNIKEGPGGLRDIQAITWIARRHFGPASLRDLVAHGFLTEEEFRTLHSGQSLLWRIRFALHTIAGRREDRLLFDHQRSVAAQFGYSGDDGGQLAVERFMKLYYRTVMEISRLNEMLCELFGEAIVERDRSVEVRAINNRFQARNHYLEALHEDVFKRYPFALLEVFLLFVQDRELKGVRATTVRLMRDHRYLIDDQFRKDLKVRSLFIEIIRQATCARALDRMHRYGILEAYLPAFGAVVGLMQFDLFHVYTVDVHTLFVVKNMKRYSSPEDPDELPMCRRVMAQIPKPELLYIAGLFHDLAKGRGVDHSELGARFATEFCEHHGLSSYDAKLVAWLVQHHLRMSTTAQRRDIADPEVINEFARLVGNRVRLDYLFLLTVADIRGTNPDLWNSWKDALLTELYDSTVRALRRGVLNPIEREEWVAEIKGEALATLCRSELSKQAILSVWQDLGEEYFQRHGPDEIAWHTRAIASVGEADLPLVLIRRETGRGGTEIFIYGRDQDHVFATTTRVLDQLGLTVMDARIILSPAGFTLDTYLVLEAGTQEVIPSEARAEEIVEALKQELACAGLQLPKVNRRAARALKHFKIPTEVSFSADENNTRTVMEVVATDRPGVLAQIATAMSFCGVRLQNAKIATFGERVEDIFYITDGDNRPIADPLKFQCLRDSVTAALAE